MFPNASWLTLMLHIFYNIYSVSLFFILASLNIKIATNAALINFFKKANKKNTFLDIFMINFKLFSKAACSYSTPDPVDVFKWTNYNVFAHFSGFSL